MSVFGDYARYYNLLYRDKDYAGEVKFVHQGLQTYAPGAQSILDLGCGTGNHAQLFAKTRYQVHGVDQSPEMLRQAHERLSQLPQEIASRLVFSRGDIRTVRLDQRFDVVVSLFHVLSYQPTNGDLQETFTTAKAHLKPGGIFLFDCWYGPAVLSERPATRVKYLEDETIFVTRIAEPVLYPNENIVDVKYHVFIKDKQSGSVEELQETHRMRYLFKPEIEWFFRNSRFRLLKCREWMTDREPGCDTWGVYFVGRLE